MVRSRRPRRRRPPRFHAGPIVAFLLIASFGILFAGCGKKTAIKGPADAPVDDITFTQDDLARFQRLAGLDSSDSGTVVGSGSGASSVPLLRAGEGSGTTQPVTLDLSMVKQYDAIRAGGGGGTEGENTCRVTNAFLNIRSEPRVSAPLLQRLNEGDTVNVLEFVNGEWAKLQLAGGKTGYAALRYLGRVTTEDKLAEEKKAFNNVYYVSYAFVNVRAKPDQKSDKLGQIPGQAFVRPLQIEGQWARVAFEGKEGYVALSYLAPFQPAFLVQQNKFTLPILHYHVSQAGVLDALAEHVARLKQAGVAFVTFRDFQSVLLQQDERKDVKLPENAVLIAVTDLTPESARRAADILYGAGVPATFFLQGSALGLSGITQKMLQTLIADGFDLQSAAQSGDDLRSLTNAQVKAELEQGRGILEKQTGRPVFAIDYPQGGVNDRVAQIAAETGFLFGVGNAPDKQFLRAQLLRLPSYTITSTMTADDVLQILR